MITRREIDELVVRHIHQEEFFDSDSFIHVAVPHRASPSFTTDWNATMSLLHWARCKKYTGIEFKSFGIEGGVSWLVSLKSITSNEESYPVIYAHDSDDPHALQVAICAAALLLKGVVFKDYPLVSYNEKFYEKEPNGVYFTCCEIVSDDCKEMLNDRIDEIQYYGGKKPELKNVWDV